MIVSNIWKNKKLFQTTNQPLCAITNNLRLWLLLIWGSTPGLHNTLRRTIRQAACSSCSEDPEWHEASIDCLRDTRLQPLWQIVDGHPLVITIFNGKTHYKWPFSIAFCLFTRGYVWKKMETPCYGNLSREQLMTNKWMFHRVPYVQTATYFNGSTLPMSLGWLTVNTSQLLLTSWALAKPEIPTLRNFTKSWT